MVSHPVNPDQPNKKRYEDIAAQRVRNSQQQKAKKDKAAKQMAMVYETIGQLMTLATTIKDTHSISLQPKKVESARLVNNNPQPLKLKQDSAHSLGVFMKDFEQAGYDHSPQTFYSHLFYALADVDQVNIKPIKKIVSNELQSRFGVCLQDPEAKRSLALALTAAYGQAAKSTPHESVLQQCLQMLLGPNSDSLIDDSLSAHRKSVAAHSKMNHLNKHYRNLSTHLLGTKKWQHEYNKLLSEFNHQKVSYSRLEHVLRTAPKGTRFQQQQIGKWLEFSLRHKAGRKLMSDGLTAHFLHQHPNDGEKLTAFGNKLTQIVPKAAQEPTKAMLKDVHQQVQKGSLRSRKGGNSPGNNPYIHHVIHDCPIMMAIFVVTMSSQGVYGFLAAIMGRLNITMGDIKKFVDATQKLQDDLNKFISDSGKDKGALVNDANKIAADQSDIKDLISTYHGKLSKGLINSLEKFAEPGGSLDNAVKEGTGGKADKWSGLTQDEAKELHDYFAGTKGGPAGKGATTVLKNLSDLMGSLNTQNQADVEKLNLDTKKVDSMTKLFAATVTMYKGLIQTLTNYSGQ